MPVDLEHTWRALEASPVSGRGGRLTRRLLPESPHDLFVGVEHPGGCRFFMVAVPAGPASRPQERQLARGLTLRVGPDPTSAIVRVEVMLDDPSYADVFSGLIADVIVHLLAQPAHADPASVVIERLRRWQTLLTRLDPQGLSMERQRGLYGELWVLRHRLLPAAPPSVVVGGWQGPENANQDFQFPGLAVEVKTSAGAQPQQIRVASERQLDDTGVGRLYLLHLALDVRAGGVGESLPEIVEDLHAQLASDPARLDFDDRLLRSGYLDTHAARYELRYTVRRESLFSVRAGFPCITEAMLPVGVGNVTYQVTWAQCQPFTVDITEIHRLLEEAS